jgi:hypothetical protein
MPPPRPAHLHPLRLLLSVTCPDDNARGRERASRVLQHQNHPNGTTHRRRPEDREVPRALFDDDDGARSGRCAARDTLGDGPARPVPSRHRRMPIRFGTTTRGWASFAGGRRCACSDHPVAASRSAPKSCCLLRQERAARCCCCCCCCCSCCCRSRLPRHTGCLLSCALSHLPLLVPAFLDLQ